MADHWTPAEVAMLNMLHRRDLTPRDMSLKMGRSETAIKRKLGRMGKTPRVRCSTSQKTEIERGLKIIADNLAIPKEAVVRYAASLHRRKKYDKPKR